MTEFSMKPHKSTSLYDKVVEDARISDEADKEKRIKAKARNTYKFIAAKEKRRLEGLIDNVRSTWEYETIVVNRLTTSKNHKAAIQKVYDNTSKRYKATDWVEATRKYCGDIEKFIAGVTGSKHPLLKKIVASNRFSEKLLRGKDLQVSRRLTIMKDIHDAIKADEELLLAREADKVLLERQAGEIEKKDQQLDERDLTILKLQEQLAAIGEGENWEDKVMRLYKEGLNPRQISEQVSERGESAIKRFIKKEMNNG